MVDTARPVQEGALLGRALQGNQRAPLMLLWGEAGGELGQAQGTARLLGGRLRRRLLLQVVRRLASRAMASLQCFQGLKAALQFRAFEELRYGAGEAGHGAGLTRVQLAGVGLL